MMCHPLVVKRSGGASSTTEKDFLQYDLFPNHLGCFSINLITYNIINATIFYTHYKLNWIFFLARVVPSSSVAGGCWDT